MNDENNLIVFNNLARLNVNPMFKSVNQATRKPSAKCERRTIRRNRTSPSYPSTQMPKRMQNFVVVRFGVIIEKILRNRVDAITLERLKLAVDQAQNIFLCLVWLRIKFRIFKNRPRKNSNVREITTCM